MYTYTYCGEVTCECVVGCRRACLRREDQGIMMIGATIGMRTPTTGATRPVFFLAIVGMITGRHLSLALALALACAPSLSLSLSLSLGLTLSLCLDLFMCVSLSLRVFPSNHVAIVSKVAHAACRVLCLSAICSLLSKKKIMIFFGRLIERMG
jgi:hypothetical protein